MLDLWRKLNNAYTELHPKKGVADQCTVGHSQLSVSACNFNSAVHVVTHDENRGWEVKKPPTWFLPSKLPRPPDGRLLTSEITSL
jgi:hypothetical protein